MIETHPFGAFVPPSSKYLILGSFPGKESGDWFYGSKRSQFWPILENVYDLSLKNKKQKQELFTKLRMAISDIILSCERSKNSNLDLNLTNIIFNFKIIENIFKTQKITTLFFSSRFVEKLFKRHFKDLISKYPETELITLPSPSPRFAAMTKAKKVRKYQELLPALKGNNQP